MISVISKLYLCRHSPLFGDMSDTYDLNTRFYTIPCVRFHTVLRIIFSDIINFCCFSSSFHSFILYFSCYYIPNKEIRFNVRKSWFTLLYTFLYSFSPISFQHRIIFYPFCLLSIFIHFSSTFSSTSIFQSLPVYFRPCPWRSTSLLYETIPWYTQRVFNNNFLFTVTIIVNSLSRKDINIFTIIFNITYC